MLTGAVAPPWPTLARPLHSSAQCGSAGHSLVGHSLVGHSLVGHSLVGHSLKEQT
jgi:hypothetical protein